MLNFRGEGLTVERLMYFTGWAPGVHFLEREKKRKNTLFRFLLRNLCNEKGKSIFYLAQARQRLQDPTVLSLSQCTAVLFALLPATGTMRVPPRSGMGFVMSRPISTMSSWRDKILFGFLFTVPGVRGVRGPEHC